MRSISISDNKDNHFLSDMDLIKQTSIQLDLNQIQVANQQSPPFNPEVFEHFSKDHLENEEQNLQESDQQQQKIENSYSNENQNSMINIPLQIQLDQRKQNPLKSFEQIMQLFQGYVQETDFNRENPWEYILLQKYELQHFQNEYDEMKKFKSEVEQYDIEQVQTLDQLRAQKQLQLKSKKSQVTNNVTLKAQIIHHSKDKSDHQNGNKIVKQKQQKRTPLQLQIRTQHSSTANLDQEKLQFLIDKLGNDIFADIRELFEFYSSINHPLKCDKMELTSFRRFCQEKLGIDKQIQGKVDLEFFKGNKSKSSKLSLQQTCQDLLIFS